MKLNKKIKTFAIVFLTITSFINAQEKESKSSFDIGLDFQSRYIWRGIQLGNNSPSMQPYAEYSTGKFSLGVWAAYSTGGDISGQELDFYATYKPTKNLSFTITDYYFPDEGGDGNYFKYSGHVLELSSTYTFKKWEFLLATNVAGNADKDNNDQAYSTYLEAKYTTFVKETEVNFHIGGVFLDKTGYYFTKGEGLINLGISAEKEIKISDSFSLPINAELIVNPDAENIFLTFGFSL